jgi:TPP-dependent trihydroxycyclohexane-1,2-dione (THcHDO) dehydratase
MYEINANNRRSYQSANARSAATVAVAWNRQGHAPKAFAVRDGEGPEAVKIIEVPITSVAGTARALAAAK